MLCWCLRVADSPTLLLHSRQVFDKRRHECLCVLKCAYVHLYIPFMVSALGLLGLHLQRISMFTPSRRIVRFCFQLFFPHWSIQCGKKSLETDLLWGLSMNMPKRNDIQFHACCHRCMRACVADCKNSAQTVKVHLKAVFLTKHMSSVDVWGSWDGFEVSLKSTSKLRFLLHNAWFLLMFKVLQIDLRLPLRSTSKLSSLQNVWVLLMVEILEIDLRLPLRSTSKLVSL